MTLVVGLVGKDFGVIVADSQVTLSNGVVNHNGIKIFRIGKNCAVGCSGQGDLVKGIMLRMGLIDRASPVDVIDEAERLAGAFRAYQIRDTTSSGWWNPPCTPSEFRGQTVRTQPMDLSALLVGFSGNQPVPQIVTVSPNSDGGAYVPVPTTAPRSIGWTPQADFLLNEYLPPSVDGRTEDSLTCLGILCILATARRVWGVDDNLQAMQVVAHSVHSLTKDELAPHVDRAAKIIDVWGRVAVKHVGI